LEHGAKGIELDVQLTKDQELVIIHDHKFNRISPGVPGKVNDYTLEEIQRIDVGSVFSKRFTGERLATLGEVLDVVPLVVILNIERKKIPIIHQRNEAILLDCLKNINREENVWISSIDHLALKSVVKQARNHLMRLLLDYRMLRPWHYANH